METETFDIPEIKSEFVYCFLAHLQVSKATGLDGISAKFLKCAAPAIINPIKKMLNLSIKKCTFPSSWKSAKVTPVLKAGGHLDKNNHRPISILPVLSKILERHVHIAL